MHPAPVPTGPVSAARWVVLAFGSLVVLIGVYWAAVRTYSGQRVENGALRGSYQVNADEVTAADDALATFTVTSLAVAVAVLAAIGWVRGGFRLAAVAVAVVGGAAVLTQLLKGYVLTRPDLVDAPPQWLHNSFPSGHTTVAMSVACAALLVVSWKWRTLAMIVVLSWTLGVGAYTVIARWHRLSDTLGADAIAVLAVSLGAAYLARCGQVQRVAPERSAPVRTVLVVLVTLYSVGMGVVGVFVGLAGWRQEPGSETADFNLYLAAQTLASVGSILAVLLAWWSWHRLETVRR